MHASFWFPENVQNLLPTACTTMVQTNNMASIRGYTCSLGSSRDLRSSEPKVYKQCMECTRKERQAMLLLYHQSELLRCTCQVTHSDIINIKLNLPCGLG
jgi:hypothetical protein